MIEIKQKDIILFSNEGVYDVLLIYSPFHWNVYSYSCYN